MARSAETACYDLQARDGGREAGRPAHPSPTHLRDLAPLPTMSHLTAHSGEIAALATAFCWSFTALFFTFGGRRLGSDVVNRSRLLIALALLVASHCLLFGRPWPVGLDLERVGWLALSAVVGLVIGDAALFEAYVLIGPRLGALMMALAPIASTAMAWAFLHQSIEPVQGLGIALTVGAVAWVVTEGNGAVRSVDPRAFRRGVVLGTVGALGQAGNLVTARMALGNGFPAISASYVRILVAAVILWSISVARGQTATILRRSHADRQGLAAVAAGAFVGPFLGIWLSLVAIERTQVGVASTIMALPPVLLIPIGYLLFRERVTRRALVGTLVAFGGVAALFLG